MQHRRHRAVLQRQQLGVDADLALLQIPVRPHVLVAVHLPVGRVHVKRVGEAQHRPDALDPGADADHDLLDLDVALVGVDLGDRPTRVGLESGDADAVDQAGAGLLGLSGETVQRGHVVGEAALLLVQADMHSLGAPVGEHRLHVVAHLGLADDQLRRVPDPGLPLVHLGEIRDLALGAECDVPHLVVAEGLRILLPHLDVGGHQLAHRGLVVVVAHNPAGDARGSGADSGLVDHQHVGLLPARGLFLGEVPGRGEAVDPGSDDEVLGARRQAHEHPFQLIATMAMPFPFVL